MKVLRKYFLLCGALRTIVFILLMIVIILSLIRISIPIMEGYLIVDQPLLHADALVVMAGSMTERLPAAAKLYENKVAEKILLTNDGVSSAYSDEKHRNLFQVEWAKSDLLKSGIPEKSIIILPYTASGTIHDALHARPEVLARGMKSILIVTSDYHTKRSQWTFKNVFRDYPITIGVYPVNSEIKNMSLVSKFKTLGSEILKLLYYRSKY